MITPEKFISHACDTLGYDLSLIRSSNRKPRFVKIRIVLSYILRSKFKLSYPEIGDLLHKDHTTIMSYIKDYEPEQDLELINNISNVDVQPLNIFSTIASRINDELCDVHMSETKKDRIGNLLWSIINEEKKLNAQ